MHARMAARIDNEGLAGDYIGRAEIGDPLASWRDGGAPGDAIISAGIETGKDAVEVGAVVGHQLPFAAELLGDALHEGDVETGGPFLIMSSKGGSGRAAPHHQGRRALDDARAEYASREQGARRRARGGASSFAAFALGRSILSVEPGISAGARWITRITIHPQLKHLYPRDTV